jgi:YD repeat-containing protein
VPNRACVQYASDPTVTTSFDEANRIDTTGYRNDEEGRLAARPGQVLEWDGLGRLTEVEDDSENVLATYTYDALDRLLIVDRGRRIPAPSGKLRRATRTPHRLRGMPTRGLGHLGRARSRECQYSEGRSRCSPSARRDDRCRRRPRGHA